MEHLHSVENNKKKTFCGFSIGSNQYWAGKVYDMCGVFLLYDGSTRRLTESDFMEKLGIEPATPGLQDIGLSPATEGDRLFQCRIVRGKKEFFTRLAIDWSICILTRPVVITGFNRSLLVDWWSISRLKKTWLM